MWFTWVIKALYDDVEASWLEDKALPIEELLEDKTLTIHGFPANNVLAIR